MANSSHSDDEDGGASPAKKHLVSLTKRSKQHLADKPQASADLLTVALDLKEVLTGVQDLQQTVVDIESHHSQQHSS